MRIQQQFKDAAKLIKDHPGKMGSGKHPYPVERDIIILYGMWNGWEYAAIGHYCRLTAPSVRRHITRLQSNPGDLFKLPILPVITFVNAPKKRARNAPVIEGVRFAIYCENRFIRRSHLSSCPY